MNTNLPLTLAQSIAGRYAALPAVEAVALAGSQTTGAAGQGSDIDLYVYTRHALPLDERQIITQPSVGRVEINNQFWEPGDEWVDAATGIHVDVMFRHPQWIEDQLNRLLRDHQASVGYTTCFWYNVLTSHILFDRTGWFTALQDAARQPYPEPLRQAVVDKNFPILTHTLSSYHYQLSRAVSRGDLVSVNHRIAAYLASYFDILLAVNRQPHPGEKRLLSICAHHCPIQPANMPAQVTGLLRLAGDAGPQVITALEELTAALERLLQTEGLLKTV